MGLKILLVDDEKEFVDALAERLSVRGFDVAVAYDGAVAIDSIKREASDGGYGAVVLDLFMPKLGGLEVLKKARQFGNNTQFIILTGHGMENDRDEALRLGAYSFLSKPVDINTLIENINKACEKYLSFCPKENPNGK
jgi:two-component system, OmpR family, response regulator CpxR